MGTSWSARAIAPSDFDARRAEDAMRAARDAIIGEMSNWEAASVLSRFNDLPRGAEIALPPHFSAVMTCALEIAEETDGAFDPSLGALVDLWGFGARPARGDLPESAEIESALACAGWRKLELREAALRQPGGLRLDFSGIAKGYAVDELARTLQRTGLNSFLVEIGGELRGAGVKPDGQPWWVDIEEPPGSSRPPIRAALHNLSIATSGDYRRFGEAGGRRIAHTLDPRTGRPLSNHLSSVTVLHSDCIRADAYATALMVMGMQAGMKFAAEHGLAARFVTGAEDFEEALSPAFQAMLE